LIINYLELMIMKPGNEAEASVPGKRGDYKPEIGAEAPIPGKRGDS